MRSPHPGPRSTEPDLSATGSVELRTVFGAFPSGVAAVCALNDGQPDGMAVSTFIPVSLDPPLIAICIQRTSATWVRLRRLPCLGVSVLGHQHEHACRQLSRKEGDRFDGLDTTVSRSGAIHVQESCAWFDCSLESETVAGDHVIAVLAIERAGMSAGTAPLVFHSSRFRRLAEVV